MKRTNEYLSDIVQQEKPNIATCRRVKVTGAVRDIHLVEKMFKDMEADNVINIISVSDILDNKGETRKRQFIDLVINEKESNMVAKSAKEVCRVIPICNQKGGVSKSATTVQLAAGLSRLGYKVLVIDADAQATLTKNLGFKDPTTYKESLTSIFEKYMNDEDVEPDFGIIHHKEGFDLVPSNIRLAGIELALVNVMNRERILKDYVTMERLFYDYILIDCMPSLGMITINVLVAADSVIIPAEADLTSADGLQELIKTIFKVKRQINPDLYIEGILLSKVDLRTNYAKEMKELLNDTYGNDIKFFEKFIPLSVKVAECAVDGSSVFTHAPKSKAADAYMSLAKEVSC